MEIKFVDKSFCTYVFAVDDDDGSADDIGSIQYYGPHEWLFEPRKSDAFGSDELEQIAAKMRELNNRNSDQ